MKITLRTFQEWSAAGYKVKKGSKAAWFEGKPLFHQGQVDKYVKSNRDYGDFDRESDQEKADYYGVSPWGGCG